MPLADGASAGFDADFDMAAGFAAGCEVDCDGRWAFANAGLEGSVTLLAEPVFAGSNWSSALRGTP